MKITQAELSRVLGNSRASITQAIKRGALVLEQDGTIDLERNHKFIAKAERRGTGKQQPKLPPKSAAAKLKKLAQPEPTVTAPHLSDKAQTLAKAKPTLVPFVADETETETETETEPKCVCESNCTEQLPGDRGKRTLGDLSSYDQARTELTRLKVQKAELDLQRAQGELVLATDVEKTAFDLARSVRDALLAIPDRLSSILSTEHDPGRVRELLDTEIRKSLEGLRL